MANTRKRAAKPEIPDVIFGQHRSQKLAERHAKELDRKYGPTWFIVARRRADGQFSTRGHFFEFRRQPEKPKLFEWIVSFTYSRTGRSFDVIVTAEDEVSAIDEARAFLKKDAHGIKVLASWKLWDVVPAVSHPVNVYTQPEYRDESEQADETEIGEESL